ncbi:hypothetical protein D3C81_1010770 [compost metagenome]
MYEAVYSHSAMPSRQNWQLNLNPVLRSNGSLLFDESEFVTVQPFEKLHETPLHTLHSKIASAYPPLLLCNIF